MTQNPTCFQRLVATVPGLILVLAGIFAIVARQWLYEQRRRALENMGYKKRPTRNQDKDRTVQNALTIVVGVVFVIQGGYTMITFGSNRMRMRPLIVSAVRSLFQSGSRLCQWRYKVTRAVIRDVVFESPQFSSNCAGCLFPGMAGPKKLAARSVFVVRGIPQPLLLFPVAAWAIT